jgi:flavodoxin
MSSTLVVVYSYTGNSRRLAQLLAAQRGWPMGEITEVKPRSGVLGFFECVRDSLFHWRPAVKYKGPDPAGFTTVVLVAPIWLQQLAGPMRSFVAQERRSIKRVGVLTTMGARGSSNAAAEVAQILGKDPVLAEAVTAREVEDGGWAAAVEGFGKMLQLPGDTAPVRPAVWSPEAG